MYHMAGNVGVGLNLAVGESNHMSLNHILPTFNTSTADALLNSYVANIKSANI